MVGLLEQKLKMLDADTAHALAISFDLAEKILGAPEDNQRTFPALVVRLHRDAQHAAQDLLRK